MASKLTQEQIENARRAGPIAVEVRPMDVNVVLLGAAVTGGLFAMAFRRYIDAQARIGGSANETELLLVIIVGAALAIVIGLIPISHFMKVKVRLDEGGVETISPLAQKRMGWGELLAVTMRAKGALVVLQLKSADKNIEIAGKLEEMQPVLIAFKAVE